MSGYYDKLLYTFVTLIALINPISAAAAFATLTEDDSPKNQFRIATRATVVATITLIAFAFAGEALLGMLGVQIGAFKIAGGMLLLKVGFDMVFAERTHRQVADDAKTDAPPTPDPSVFPLAIPIITGPGVLTASVALINPTDKNHLTSAVIFVVVALVVVAITYASMLGAEKLTQRFGQTGIDAVGRVVGIVVAAIAVQMIVNGVSDLTHFKL
ncbi:MAG TPA: MarC family protein [Candidatus Cybelea sp.]|nr:MarC family protein [Candidatus Cybelea sp.]